MSLRWDIKPQAVSEGSDLQDADAEGVDTEAGSSREGLAISVIGAARTQSRGGKPGGGRGPKGVCLGRVTKFP